MIATRQRGQWIFVHLLALVTAATTVLYFWLQANFDLTAEPPQIPFNVALIALLGTIAMFWFWYVRRWFTRRFVPSPGELPTVELEASKE